MRKKISLLIISIFISGIFVSCWDDFTERTYYSANVTSFSFGAHDSCPNIEDYIFNINQMADTGLIYNLDSLPFYVSHVNRLFPNVSLQSTNGNIFMNDSLWEDGDSIDFTSPVILKNTSIDGLYTRVYKITVNVHQLDPDSMIMNRKANNYPTDGGRSKAVLHDDGYFYNYFELNGGGMSAYVSTDKGLNWLPKTVSGLAGEVNLNSLCQFNSKWYITTKTGQLYSSTDGLTWSASGDGTKIVTLFGPLKRKYLTETNPVNLIGLAKNTSGNICFAKSANGFSWTIGAAIDSVFPVTDYALTTGTTATGIEFYTIATGLNSAGNFTSKIYSTETGENWACISDGSDPKKSLGKRIGASIFYYDKYLVCFGGIDPNGSYHKDLLISLDHGKGWIKAPTGWAFAKMNEGVAYSGVYIERKDDTVNDKKREFIWIFGGSKASGKSSEVWYGYINSMLFTRR